MAKAGMRRPDPSQPHGTYEHPGTHKVKNEQGPVPEIQGKAKTGKAKAGPINAPNWARDDYKSGQ